MNTQSTGKPSNLKISLIFTGSVLLLSLVLDLIATFFKLDYFLRWDYLWYNIGLEGFLSFLAALGTIHFTSRLADFAFKTIVIRVIVFAVLYALLPSLTQLIIYLSLLGSDMHLFMADFRIITAGIKLSFILIVIWMVLKYRQKD